MTREEILERVFAFLCRSQSIDKGELSPDMPLSETVLVDSLTVLETVMFLEDEFGLQLSRADLGEIRTPESIVELVVRKMSSAT